MADDVDAVMQTVPERWRTRWCGGERGPCACFGCVQIGNRLIMATETLGRPVTVYDRDPEHIDESRIPKEIYDRLKITKAEWEDWMRRNGFFSSLEGSHGRAMKIPGEDE